MKQILLSLCVAIAFTACTKKEEKVKTEPAVYMQGEEDIKNFEKNLNHTNSVVDKLGDRLQESKDALTKTTRFAADEIKDTLSATTVYTVETALEKIDSSDPKEKYLAALSLYTYGASAKFNKAADKLENKKTKTDKRLEKAYERAKNYQLSLHQKTKNWINQHRDTHVKAILEKNKDLSNPTLHQQPLKKLEPCEETKLKGLLKKHDYKYLELRLVATMAQDEKFKNIDKLMKDIKETLKPLKDPLSKELLGTVEGSFVIMNRIDSEKMEKKNKATVQSMYERVATRENINILDAKKQVKDLYNQMPSCFQGSNFFKSYQVIKNEESLNRGKRIIPHIVQFKKAKGTYPDEMYDLCNFLKDSGKATEKLYNCVDTYQSPYQIVSDSGKLVLWSLGRDRKINTKDDIKIGVIE